MLYLSCKNSWIQGCFSFSAALLFFVTSSLAQPYGFVTFVGSASNPGTSDGTNAAAQFISPTGLGVDSLGTLYVTDGNAVRSISVSGTDRIVRTLAGSIGSHSFVDGTNGAARLNYPQSVAVDTGGTLYVADTYNNAIRKMSPAGTNWVVTTIAGPPPPLTFFGTSDGTNTDARFHNPYGIAVDGATNVYVADSLNHAIRKLTAVGPNWVVTTIAGLAGTSGTNNGSNAVARFNKPASVAVDSFGNLYVADSANDTIRKLTQSGTNWVVSTLAGTAGVPGAVDGAGGGALFDFPQCVAVDGALNVFVTDSGNYTIRKITPAGTVTTLAGNPGVLGTSDGTGSSATFTQPYGIVVDPRGVVYVADYLGYAIRQGQLVLLNWSISGKKMVLSWCDTLAGFTPEKCAYLNGSWSSLPTNGIVHAGQSFYLTNDISAANGWFRLRN